MIHCEVIVAKNTRGVKEFTREQKLIKENRQLKRELAHLRKQISRLDLEGIEAAKQICFDEEEKQKLNEELGSPISSIEALRKEWECKECHLGWLEITLYSKINQTFYYRKCNNCTNRTKGQRYDSESVKGIIFKPSK
jgi:hypothetical protein